MNRDALERELAAARAERDEAQARAAALAEVLQAINASPQQPGPVFDMVIGKAMVLCDAAFGALLTYAGDHLTMAAQRNGPPALVAHWETPQYVDPATATSQVLHDGKTSQIVDLAQSENYRKRLPMTVASVELGGIRTLVLVPLRSERGPIGLFILYRREVRPFTERQIALVEAFADQAALAMENARLIDEQRQALEQQTATADILRVISRSPTDVEPVMTAVAKAAVRFCGAEDAHVFLRDGDEMVSSAHEGPLSSHALGYRDALDASNTARADTILEARVTHLPDTLAPEAEAAYRSIRENSIQHGFRAQLNAPMLKDGQAIGCICLRRRDPGAFIPRQIALLETFAAQAVIAIENVRLFTELRDSLEQQTASADVLRVISQSPTSVQPVFDVIAESALRLLGGWSVIVWRYDGSRLHIGAAKGGHPGSAEALPAMLEGLAPEDIFVGDAVHNGAVQRIIDIETEAVAPQLRELARARGWRSNLAVPMMREGQPVGVFTLARTEPGAFSERDVQLLQSFAAQAVIAIENVRLFTELREALEQQTATSEILGVISQSPTDVDPVLTAVAKAMLRFCGGEDAIIGLRDGDNWLIAGHEGILPASIGMRVPLDRQTSPGAAILDATTVHYPDIAALDPVKFAASHDFSRRQGFRAAVAAPMLREGVAVGAVVLRRAEPGAFTPRQIELLEGFAAQAVIAIENTRLFTELRESLDYQTATSDVLNVISRSTSELEPVLRSMLAAATRLCGVHMGGVAVRRGDILRYVTSTGVSAKFDKWLRETPHPMDRTSIAGRAALDKRVTYIPNLAADPDYAMPITTTVGNMQSLLAVPLLREDEVVGVMTLGRSNTEPFTERQIALVRTFADQAVIAMENTRLLADLRESLDYQTATSEVLEVISRSTSDLMPVLNKMLAAAAHLCGVQTADVSIRQDGAMRYAASIGTSPEQEAWLRSRAIEPGRTSCAGRALLERQVVQVLDMSLDAELAVPREAASSRTVLSVPLLREGEAIGVITVLRDHVEAFTERQIALIKTFADQAVIAIENARLLGELRERTDDLTESLEYQTATSDLLEVISRSTSDIQPVLDRMLSSAARLCGVAKGDVAIRQGEVFRHVAFIGAATPEEDAWLRSRTTVPGRGTSTARALLEKQVDHVLDQSRDPERIAPAAATAARTTLSVPLLREGEAIGVISLLRDRVEAFTERQIALVKTFADQAVIAMENARLLTELRESLDQQTATSDVLKTISRSPVNLDAVLDTLVETVARLCRADQAYMFRGRGELHHLVASHGLSDEAQDYIRTHPFEANERTLSGRVTVRRQTVHIADVLQEKDYGYGGGQKVAGFRTMLGIPLLAQNQMVGIFVVTRTRVEPFSDKEIALAAGFADQAVIAIENTRLFEELRERQSELRVTFDNMGDAVVMFDAQQRLAAWNRNFQEMLDVSDSFLAERPTLDDYVRLLVGRGELGQVADIEAEMVRFRARFEQQWSAERTRPNGRILEVRNNPVPGGGAVLIYSDITERKKSESAIRAARDAAEAALVQLKAAQANLVQSEKMASLGQLTAGIAHEIKNPLNFVNNFATLSVELLDELKEIAGPALETLDEDKRADLDETMGLLTGNLGKIAEHGKRADGIVKSMLSHSRGGSGDWQASDINALVEEALNLAYHGARAQDKEFNVTLERDFEKDSKPIELVPQDVMRVFLNLVGNGFYATNKRRLAREAGFRPTLKVSTRDLGDGVEIRVRDNGIGIPAEVRDKLFQPFFTTKPTGEGTGLGLSISYDIVTQQHGGAIEVESEVGRFTEFTVRLPRVPRVASAKKA